MRIRLLLGIVLWLLCGGYTYPTCVAMSRHDFSMIWSEDNGRFNRGACAILAPFTGPVGVIMFALYSGANAYGFEL